MENVTLSTRIFDFMKRHVPFNLLDDAALERLSRRVSVRYYAPGQTVFSQDTKPGHHIYLVHDGAVQLVREKTDGTHDLVDACAEGDVFGVRPLLAAQAYELTARVVEETLIYAINMEGFEHLLLEHPKVAYYLASTFAAGARLNNDEQLQQRIYWEQKDREHSRFELTEVQVIDRCRPAVTCHKNKPIRKAARIMTENNQGAIIITNKRGYPRGIVTDRDLRARVVTGEVDPADKVKTIMSQPVITITQDRTVADAQILMITHRINRLVVTNDGTPDSEVQGTISVLDLLMIQGNHPALLIQELQQLTNGRGLRELRERAEEMLRKYIYQEVSIEFISTVMTEINDTLIRRCIELSVEAEAAAGGGRPPAVAWAWLALGSEGRGEQLLRTDQDSALVYADVPEAEDAAVRAYFLRLARRVTDLLHSVGFDYCPGEMMAVNPKWCQPLRNWRAQFGEWIEGAATEGQLKASIFFDFRAVYGSEALTGAMSAHILEQLKQQTIFLSFLARNVVQNPPPLTFFRNFLVESSGEHKNGFDLKKRAMQPLADAARTLVLQSGITGTNNTIKRFQRMAELEPQNRELYENAAYAYGVLMRFRALQGLKYNDSGRYLDPSTLTKMQRLLLRNSFRPLKDLQEMFTLRFQLNLIG